MGRELTQGCESPEHDDENPRIPVARLVRSEFRIFAYQYPVVGPEQLADSVEIGDVALIARPTTQNRYLYNASTGRKWFAQADQIRP
jgi:hypothetical protein